MKSLRALTLVIIAGLLSACASTNISPEERLALKRVNIAPIVLPKKPVVFSAGSGAAFIIAGPLGVALASGASDLPTAYKELLAKNKIDVAAIIHAELKTQLQAKGFEVVDNENQADAVLSVQMLQYGLTGDAFSSERFPQYWAKFRLTKRNGGVIWKNWDAAHISKDVVKQVEARPIPDYFNDPKLLDSQIRKVTRIISVSVTSTLQ
jgi:hypothetical protein